LLLLIHALGPQGAPDCQAQGDDSAAVISATLTGVRDMLQTNRDAVIQGPLAFDPRVLRADQGPAPRGWPDTVALIWVGDVRDSVLSSQRVDMVLDNANRAVTNPIRWVACGTGSRLGNCNQSEFSAIIALSEPLVCGDAAQVLASIRYRSTNNLHPSAWQASVIRLRRVDGKWTASEWYTQATN
jgi:hypothetical protein